MVFGRHFRYYNPTKHHSEDEEENKDARCLKFVTGDEIPEAEVIVPSLSFSQQVLSGKKQNQKKGQKCYEDDIDKQHTSRFAAFAESDSDSCPGSDTENVNDDIVVHTMGSNNSLAVRTTSNIRSVRDNKMKTSAKKKKKKKKKKYSALI
eukprot:Lankesteria_metandrocarpae@DN4429_c0_g1_i5.p1